MPSGRPEVVAPIINKLMAWNPDSILDVGSGFGKWGILIREYLEVWQGRLSPETWIKRVDALEIFAPYTKMPWYDDVYNNVIIGDILSYIYLLGQYDVVLFLDVIEHLEKEDGEMILSLPKRWIVSTPNYDSGQGQSFNNIHEKHRSVWNPQDFVNYELIEGKWIVAWK